MEPVILQIIDWIQYHEVDNTEIIETRKTSNSNNNYENDDELDELEKELEGGIEQDQFTKYKIRLFGRTSDNKSVIVNVNNYTPFFYIKVPNDWSQSKIFSLVGYIKTKISNTKIIKGLKSFDIVKRKDLYGFTAYKDFQFVRLIFHNMKSYKAFEYWIAGNKISNALLSKYPFKLQLYESNIEPFIRCMHIRKLNACGWVKISNYTKYDNNYSHCDISIQTDWLNLETYDSNTIQKFVIASWDIECMSTSGNFPQAIEP